LVSRRYRSRGSRDRPWALFLVNCGRWLERTSAVSRADGVLGSGQRAKQLDAVPSEVSLPLCRRRHAMLYLIATCRFTLSMPVASITSGRFTRPSWIAFIISSTLPSIVERADAENAIYKCSRIIAKFSSSLTLHEKARAEVSDVIGAPVNCLAISSLHSLERLFSENCQSPH
jgi:hypothetical protein